MTIREKLRLWWLKQRMAHEINWVEWWVEQLDESKAKMQAFIQSMIDKYGADAAMEYLGAEQEDESC